jgi:hypothetical protein
MKKVLFLVAFFGALCLGGYAQSYWSLTGNGGTNPNSNFIGTSDAQPLIFKTNNAERMRLLSNKPFLGIGVSNPQSTLHLHYQQDYESSLKLLQLTTYQTGNSANDGLCIFSDKNTNDILLKQQETSKLLIETPGGGIAIAPDGKVGFGTTAPEGEIHVIGKLIIDRPDNTLSGLLFKHSKTKGQLPPTSYYSPYWDIYADCDGLKFNTLDANGLNTTQRMIISGGGGIGIGVNIPTATLDVSGSFKAQSASITNTLTVNDLSALGTATVTGNTYLNGNVGIGNTTPQATLDVSGSFKAQSANITGTTTTNVLGAQNANITGTTTTNVLGAQNANITGNTYLSGNVGIGVINNSSTVKLDVVGTIRSHEVKVCLNQGCDYVFNDDYKLMNLKDLNNFIKDNKHLPDVAPAAEMETEGINLSEMNALLLRKIEELTLYILDLQKQINDLKK